MTTIIDINNIDQYDVETIIAFLQQADDAYFNSDQTTQPIVTDQQYDAIKQYGYNINRSHPYFNAVGSEVRGGKVPLPYKMGSLNQIYENDYQKWIDTNNLQNQQLVITDKLDGTSNLLVFNSQKKLQIAYSRGDGERGADITRHISKIPSIMSVVNCTGNITVRGETIISDKNFAAIKQAHTIGMLQLKRDYKNGRNMVAGLMNSSEIDPRLYQFIDVVVYEIVGSNLSKSQQLQALRQMGFKVVNFTTANSNDLNDQKLTDIVNEAKSKSLYQLDGIVIDVNDHKIRQKIDKKELNPTYAVKYKVTDKDNVRYPVVKNVEWKVSKDGYLKPRINIEPTELVGATIQYATGYNASFIYNNQIGPGAVVKLIRAGDVIPSIVSVVTPMQTDDYQSWFNQQLDQYQWQWSENIVDIILTNSEDNKQVQFEKLKLFFDTIDIPHLGQQHLQTMFDKGFVSPESIITLIEPDIQGLIESKVIGTKIYKGMIEKLTNIPMYKLMGSYQQFGRGIGVRKMKKLYQAFEGDITKCSSIDNIVAVDGFDVKTATKIVNGYPQFVQFINEIQSVVTIEPYSAPKQGSLTGASVVVTGFRDSEFDNHVVNQGGKISTSVSSKTSFVVTNDVNQSSSKLDKARKFNIAIFTKDQFIEKYLM